MVRTLAVLGLAGICAASVGCGARDYTGEERFAISGKVSVDGEPMEMGVISFLPLNEDDRVSGGPIRQGTYSVPEEKGPNAGTYRVEIHWNKPTGRRIPDPFDRSVLIDELQEGLPARYHTNSELTAEVSPDQTTFDFDLKTK